MQLERKTYNFKKIKNHSPQKKTKQMVANSANSNSKMLSCSTTAVDS